MDIDNLNAFEVLRGKFSGQLGLFVNGFCVGKKKKHEEEGFFGLDATESR